MPWNTVDLMDEKLRFIHLAKSGRFTMTELCYDFSISRKTGHKYLIATIKKKNKKAGDSKGGYGILSVLGTGPRDPRWRYALSGEV